MERFFPGSYELVEPGADTAGRGLAGRATRDRGTTAPVRIAFCLEEERGALRLFLRALRRLPLDLTGRRRSGRRGAARGAARAGGCATGSVSCGPREASPEELIAGADVVCAASGGPRPAPGLVRKALASGTVPVASQLPLYEELAGDGERGLLFPPGDAITLAGQLERLIAEPRPAQGAARGRRGRGPRLGRRSSTRSRRSTGASARAATTRAGKPAVSRRLANRRQIHVDLHMHTDHSPDCATPVEVLLGYRARSAGSARSRSPTTTRSPGRSPRARSPRRWAAIKVIVAEEVKTAEQGEVIGLFLEEKIPRGMTMAETIAEIRRQGGLVYVPHPFDRLHSVPDYEHLLDIVEEIDILEVFNPRVALTAFNEEAERFAAKYRIVPGAGSDSHVAQGLGSVMIRVHDFDGARGVPRGDARRRHRPQAQEPRSTSRRSSCCRRPVATPARRDARPEAAASPPARAGLRRRAGKR